MAARRAASAKSHRGNAHSKRSPVSTPDLQWTKRTDETHTAMVEPGLVVTLAQTRFTYPDGHESYGAWRGQISKHDGTVVMQSADESYAVTIAAVGEYVSALTLVRERDPQPH